MTGQPRAPGAAGPTRSVSVIAPTFREAENLPQLVARLGELRAATGLDLELVIVDDDSRDGTEEVVAGLGQDWIRLIVRRGERGLSSAVLAGMAAARHDTFVVMDADLSHPPERIPALVGALDAGAELSLGSRYVPGASTDETWGIVRWINSKAATLLARPLTSARDPMSGFFALRRETWARATSLNPIGYKILLELIVKCHARDVREVPIHFANRYRGESKLDFREQLRYLKHLRRLFLYRFAEATHLAQFVVVGATGVVVNLLVLTLARAAGLGIRPAAALAIGLSMVSNFALNRRFTFSYARDRSIVGQFLGFCAACSLGALANYGVVVWLAGQYALLARYPQIAALAGVLVGTGFNYAMSRGLVFAKPRPEP